MKLLFVVVAALATTFSTAAAQGTPASANTAAKSSANSGSQPKAKGAKVVVSPGGQGHNSGPDPKGKILVAPTTSTSQGKQTSQTNAATKPPQ